MKRSTLAVLLVIPILIALVSFVSVLVLNNTVAVDITDILWGYNDNEMFKVKTDAGYQLEATAVYDQDKVLADGNDLVWYVSMDEENENCAEIRESNGIYYLYALQTGDCVVTCANERGTKSKSFNAVLYDNGAVVINTVAPSSQENVDPTAYYGQYDPVYDSLSQDGLKKQDAEIDITVSAVLDDDPDPEIRVLSKSDNITYSNDTIFIHDSGESWLTLCLENSDEISATYSFTAVEDGVNCYSYNDLMMCTNFSTDGEVAVMQTSLGSMYDTYTQVSSTTSAGVITYTYSDTKKSNVYEPFGNPTFTNGSFSYGEGAFSFEEEVYTFTSTYHTEHVQQLNAAGETFATDIVVGVHAQKSIYGNGFTINMSNLAFPNNGSYEQDSGDGAKLVPDSTLDLFQGPLSYIVVGTSSLPMVRAFAQDNIGLYLDGDNITVNDLKVKNCDSQDNMYNYNYTGTVIDVNGDNCTIENSIVADGKNVVRAFSTDNLLIDNCILRNGGEFLLQLGSNKENKADYTQTVEIETSSSTYRGTLQEYFDAEGDATNDASRLWYMLTGSTSKSDSLAIMNQLLSYMTNTDGMINSDGSYNYDGDITVRDTYFYNSGIFSIAFECSFNGPFLVNGTPVSNTKSETYGSIIKQLGPMLFGQYPDDIGGTSYPVKLTLEGDTKFYDWKSIDAIDMTGLIYQNITSLFTGGLGVTVEVEGIEDFSVDDIFRIKELLLQEAKASGSVYTADGVDYLNTSVIWYGGGSNFSTLVDNTTTGYTYSSETELDMADTYFWSSAYSLELLGVDLLSIMSKAVLAVTGSGSFKYVSNGRVGTDVPDLFGQVPQISDLKD